MVGDRVVQAPAVGMPGPAVAIEQVMTREASDDRVAGMASFGGVADDRGINSCGACSDGAAGTVTRSRSVAVESRLNGWWRQRRLPSRC